MKAIYGYGPLNWNGFGWKRKLFLKSFAWSLAESDWIFFEFKTVPSRLYHYSSGTWKDFEKDKKIHLLESIF